MKKQNLKKQYNNVAKDFVGVIGEINQKSVNALNKNINPFLKKGVRAIDFGCGNGELISYLQSKSIYCCGVDTSSEMTKMAKNNTGADIRTEDFAKTTFKDRSFDLIVSKWAMQTSPEIEPIYKEANRLLKKDGFFVFLTVHPMRQFIEKKKLGKDYFKKEIVDSIIFDGTITVKEPSHTIKEYLSDFFLKKFTLINIEEGAEFPAAEQVNGDIYPTYLIITAQKR